MQSVAGNLTFFYGSILKKGHTFGSVASISTDCFSTVFMMWICKGSEMLLYERLFYCGLSASLGCQFISASLSVLLCTLVLIRTSDSLMDTFSSCGISHSSVGSLSLDLSTSTSGRIDILSKHKGPVRGKGLGLELRSHDSSEVCFLLL